MWPPCVRCRTTSTSCTGWPRRDPKTFARYWKERERLEVAFAEVVADGVDAGELREVDARLAALTVMSNDEATQNWMRHDPRRKARRGSGGGGPYAIGTFLADLTVRGLLSAPRDLERIRRSADALDARSAMLE